MITASINGEREIFSKPLTFKQLLENRGLAGSRVAIERNGTIVVKSRHDEETIADGDCVEIVIAVSGG